MKEKTFNGWFGCCRMSSCFYHERWCTYTVQTGGWAHTPEEQWLDEGSLAGDSSSCPLYQGRLQGCRAAEWPLWVSEGSRIHVWDNSHLKNFKQRFLLLCSHMKLFNLPHVSVCLHTPSALWGLSSSMVSSSTSCCPLGSESSAGYDSWTQRKAEVACTLTLKHTCHDQVKNSFRFILTYIVVYKRVLPSYHIHVGWSQHSGREPHHQMSRMSETLL